MRGFFSGYRNVTNIEKKKSFTKAQSLSLLKEKFKVNQEILKKISTITGSITSIGKSRLHQLGH